MNNTIVESIVPVAHILHEIDKNVLNVNYNIHTTTPGINANPSMSEWDFIDNFREPCARQHQTYTGQLEILFNHIRSEADTTAVPG